MCHINLCPRIYYRVPPNYFLGDPHQLTADTLSDINSDSLCGILPDIFPDIYLALYLAFFLLTFYLAFLLAFYLPYFLTVYFAFCLTHTHRQYSDIFFWHTFGSVCAQPRVRASPAWLGARGRVRGRARADWAGARDKCSHCAGVL